MIMENVHDNGDSGPLIAPFVLLLRILVYTSLVGLLWTFLVMM